MTVLDFLANRFSALSASDYATVYDSYHKDAPFLKQFCTRRDYLDFARQQLGSVRVKTWRCLQQRKTDENCLEALLVMEIETDGASQLFYELALLIKTEVGGWSYHSAQKLGMDDYSGLPNEIDFHHFDDVTEKIRF